MGDFNVELLKYNTNNDSIAFYNYLSSHFVSTFILNQLGYNQCP